MAKRRLSGFSLTELMVALVVTSLAMVSVISFHVGNKVRASSEELKIEVQQNLRLALDRVLSSLRNSNYGIPTGGITPWINWVGGFNANPLVTAGPPPTISVASCGLQPTTTLANSVPVGSTSLVLGSAAEFNATTKRMLYIDDFESAIVRAVGSNTITIDTDPMTAGNQGTVRAYPAGTTICRVDVTTYSINSARRTLRMDLNQGAGPVELADGITDMSVVVATGGAQLQYTVTLTGQSSKKDPTTNSLITATLTGSTTQLK
jgi:prepilin-type N-terminal cleavage/methylation domain-containing protein